MRNKMIGTILVIFFILIWLSFQNTKDKNLVPDREPFDGSILPNRALDAVCVLGWPVLVKYLDEDLEDRFVIFPGPVRENMHKNAEVFSYVGYFVSTPPNQFGDATNLLQTLNKHREQSLPDELANYQLLTIDGLPEQLSEVVELLGPWNTLIDRSNPKRQRMVWRRTMCIGKQLIYGLWIEVINDRVIKTGGVTDNEKLDRML